MTIFAASVFDATVIFEGNELFKGQGSASMWAEKLAAELGSKVTVEKVGTGWVLVGRSDGEGTMKFDPLQGLYQGELTTASRLSLLANRQTLTAQAVVELVLV